MSDFDVVVVGAGPVGLLTAIELSLGGVRVLVMERLPAASTASKAFGVGPLGSEALERRGMAAAIAAAEARGFAAMRTFTEHMGADQRPRTFSGHFAGLVLLRSDAQDEPGRRARMVDQPAIELMLAERGRGLGVEVRREHEVTNLVEHADGVDVEWASPTGDGRVSCSYLVGCDGGRSPIRKMTGFDFPGTDPSLTMYTAFVEIDHPAWLLPLGWHRTSGGMFAYGPLPGRLSMLDFSGPPEDRQAPVTRREIEATLRRISGTDVRVTAMEGASRWTDNTRLVDTYRRGRVLLAGDAAHVHSPFGGQGMSLGLVDAANLGWKLAAVVRGEMPDALLDTYTAERRPVAQAVLANTLAQTAIMRPDPQSGAMRDIVAKLMQVDDVNRLIGGMMSGLSSRYDLGSDQGDVGRLIGDRPVEANGVTVPLYDLLRDGEAVLLDADATGRIRGLAVTASRRVRRVAIAGHVSMLIRPDACVAWTGGVDDLDGLNDALARWFGHAPPRQPAGRGTPVLGEAVA